MIRFLKKKYPTIKISGNIHIRNSFFGKYNYIQDATILNSSLDDFSYVASNSYVNNCKIGKFSCIGPNVKIGLGTHPVDKFISVHPIFYSNAGQVGITFADRNYFEEFQKSYIGNDVWIGANVIIKGGVCIGDGAVIASGAVVTQNVPEYTIVGGVPAKMIRKRFSNLEIEKMSVLKWWDMDMEFLQSNYKYFHDISNMNMIEANKMTVKPC